MELSRLKKTVDMTNKRIKEIKSEFICVTPVVMTVGGYELLSISVKTKDDVEFYVETNRCLDISDLKYKGCRICYKSPVGVRSGFCFDYTENSFSDNMFFGLLTTCGLENAGPQSVVDGEFYSQHGSINNCEAENVSVEMSADCKNVYICGDIEDRRYCKHRFVLHRKITYEYSERKITVTDRVENKGKRDQLCLMYHYNFGSPFLSENCCVEIPYVDARPKNKDAENGIKEITKVFAPYENSKPQVFYLRLSKGKEHYAKISNKELNVGITLSFEDDGLPKMDLWKNFQPNKYVMSFEPCNAYPYGRQKQRMLDEAVYLDEGRTQEFVTRIKVEDYNEKA